MNIKIEVLCQVKALNQKQLQTLRRVAGVLAEHDFEVDVNFAQQTPEMDDIYDPYLPSFAGAEYPSPAYHVELGRHILKHINYGTTI